MKLATASQMQKLDHATIHDIAIPGVVLMENAGKGTVEVMEQEFGSVQDLSVIIFVGPGNNGGDGLVIARHVLQQRGFPFLVYLIEPDKLAGDAAINQAACKAIRIPHMVVLQDDDIAQLTQQIQKIHFEHPVHSLVDGLFGTGLKRNLRGHFAAIVGLINKLSAALKWPIAAVDISSGLSADTGKTLGCSVQADLTVTYGLAKPGHYLHGGPSIGKLKIVDIGIPEQVIQSAGLPGKVLNQEIGNLLHPRQKSTHKGDFGHILILAGSEGKTGAAILSAQAALHSGCGLVTLAVPAELNSIFEISLPEAMTAPLPCSATAFSSADYEKILGLLADKDGMVIGPGLGTDSDTGVLVRKLYAEVKLPMVVDADALNLLAGEPVCIAAPAGDRILTPHPGEMARLTGMKTPEIQADRLQAASRIHPSQGNCPHEIITVLKGAGTILSSSRGQWAINTSGNNGMATGGMGDVLAGLIGSLLVQGYTPWNAAQIGVYMHGLAADMLAENSSHGYLASDVAATLPSAAQHMKNHLIQTTEQDQRRRYVNG